MQKKLLLITLILVIAIKEITAKVALKGNFTGVKHRRNSGSAGRHNHLSVDLSNYFDFNFSKNPNFSIKQISKGNLTTINTLQSSIALDGSNVIFFMELPNKIAKLISSRTLRLIDLDPNGKITSFNDISLKKENLEHCFDMRYIEARNALVLGCLDDPHDALVQMYFVYSFDTETVYYTEYDQSQDSGLEIAGRMVPAGDGVICYVQNSAFTSFYYWKIEEDFSLSKQEVSYRLVEKLANPVDSMRHEFYYEDGEWRRRLVVFEDAYRGKMVSSYNMMKDGEGKWIVKPSQTVYKDLDVGSCILSSGNQKFSWCCNEAYSQLTRCRNYGGSVVSDYEQSCALMTGVNTHFIDLTPVRVSAGDEGFGILHYRTWPRRSIGGNQFFPGRNLYPKFQYITMDYNLNDKYNYTIIRNNIYTVGTDVAEHRRIANPQFRPDLEMKGSYQAEVTCKDDDNEVTLVIPVEVYEGLGEVDIGLERVSVKGEQGTRTSFDVFSKRFKGNLVRSGSFGDDSLFINDMGALVIIDVDSQQEINRLDGDYFYFCGNSFLKYLAGNQQILWHEIVSFTGDRLEVKQIKQFEADKILSGVETLECSGETLMLKTSSEVEQTSFLLITESSTSYRTISPPAHPSSSKKPEVIPSTTSTQFIELDNRGTIATTFISKAEIPPFNKPRSQIQMMKIVETKNREYYPLPITLHTSTLFHFCPQSLSYKNSTGNSLSILSICPLTSADEPPRVDLIHAKYDDFDFEVERKVSLYLGTDFLLHSEDAQICRFGDEELFVISLSGKLVYSVDIKNPENYRKIDFSGFGQNAKSSSLVGFSCLQTAGVLGLVFDNGVGGIKAGEIYDTSSRFLFFHLSDGASSLINDITTTSGETLIIIRDESRNSLTYYNTGIPKLIADLTSAAAGKKPYRVVIGNEETTQTLEVDLEVTPRSRKPSRGEKQEKR